MPPRTPAPKRSGPRLAAVAVACLAAAAGGGAGTASAAAATGPVGWDSFRRLDLIALERPGVHARMSSSWDRTGANDDGLSGRWSCLRLALGRCVIAEHVGAGELADMWFTRDRGNVTRTGNIRVELDGQTVLDRPLQAVVDGRVGAPFAFPLVANAARSSGGVYIKVPMPYRERMLVTTDANPRYYHVVHRTFDDPQGVSTFNPADPAHDVLDRLRAAGLRDPKPAPRAPERRSGFAVVGPARRATALRLSGAGTIGELRLALRSPGGRPALEEIVRRSRLVVWFDGRVRVDAPVGELFGSGAGPATVRSLFVAQSRGLPGDLVSWWPMPFREGAAIVLVNPTRHPARLSVRAVVDRASDLPARLAAGEAGYFRASWRAGATAPGRPWPVLAARGRGVLVGLMATLDGPRRVPNHLEGDPLIVADGGPALRGTGTEDLFEGGWYWNRGAYTLPLTGAPVRRVGGLPCRADCTAAYRLMVADAIPFSSSLRFSLEHGPANRIPGRYSTTALWYG